MVTLFLHYSSVSLATRVCQSPRHRFKMKLHQLSDAHLFSYSKAVYRMLMRLSKPSLLRLVLLWLDDPFCMTSKGSVQSVRDASIYKEWAGSNTVSRRDIVERIVNIDWKAGLCAKQIAMLDMQYIFDHATALRWTARKISGLEGDIRLTPFDGESIVTALRNALDSVFFNHIYWEKHPRLPLFLIRIQIQDAFVRVLPPPRRIFYMALSFGSPFLFHTMIRDSLHDMLLQAMEIFLFLKHRPVQLFHTNMTIRNIEAMVKRKGASRHPSALGAWSIYAENEVDTSPIDPQEKVREPIPEDVLERQKYIAGVRFGKDLDKIEDALDRLAFRLEEVCMDDDDDDGKSDMFRPSVTLVFEGGNVLAGLKEMCEKAIANAEQIPSWLTGEDGVTEGVIYNGLSQTIK
ncbi:hypothetical protein T552_01076 [Pneumocystis carinii B80]|uniref:Uncharacterized protein n=1 Tax=Pneumocystis carinii (strain B80) TaxID=1408658 RepID=A0A0W4ZNC2_PNEC8|nr:hypothetical protein T552_01076 [Pneumocystis carinii B80]KTW29872.1 hypothetical protein T552_01076 [Pneumocystis carinii B80]